MRSLYKVFVITVLGLAVIHIAPASAIAAAQSTQSPTDKAFEASKNKAWGKAAKYASQTNDPLTVKIIEWLRYQKTDPQLSFAAIAAFIETNPNWPRHSRLRRSAEAAIATSDDAVAVNDWFERYPPLSGAGALAHLDALTAVGELSKVRTLVANYWQDLDYKREDDKAFKRRYGKHLANADHFKRLDRLIWDRRYGSAQRMLGRVEAPQAALGRARIALMRREGGVDGAIAKVPAALKDAPGLQYERLRWRRRKGMDQSARELLVGVPSMGGYPEKWAQERLILARRALFEGHYSEAKRMIASHNLTSGEKFAEAEFLAGWISLTFLDEPEVAYKHFTHLYEGVGYPISRSRGAFWAGQAAAASDDKKNALRWWNVAAEFPATFYGQQAIAALGKTELRIAFATPQNPPVATDAFQPELMRAVRLLHRHEQKPLIVPFLRQLTHLSNTLDERFAIVDLANEVDHPHEAVRAAKRAAQLDNVVPAPSYPFLQFENNGGSTTAKQQREAPLVLALIRQESAFDPRALSRVGARGMMQLMPATAKRVARAAGQPYSRARLLDDPRYNIQLGTAYLDSMLSKFDDTPALALAAYNAGPSRVNRWIKQMGDPRTGEIALIDWIESIPFGETRNYVQRVLESETVYRELLLNEQIASMPTPSIPKGSEENQP
jgi:soluble lytic murein transglycosylase